MPEYIEDEEFTLERAHKYMNDFEKTLLEICPNPGNVRLLELDKEYTNSELRHLLQTFGSYLATLSYNQKKIEAECNLLKKALKTGTAQAMLAQRPEGSTVTEKEAFLLKTNQSLMYARKMEIINEMYLDLIKGWVDAYDNAYTAVSRIVSVEDIEGRATSARTA